MKKFIIVFQIIAILSQNVYAQDTTAPTIRPPMPADYYPETTLVDSASNIQIYNRYRTKDGQRVDVKGYVGKFGIHSFDEDFRQRLYEIETQHEGKVEIILTLSSRLGDAMVLKKRMELSGRKAEIVELPDELQKRFLEKAEIIAAGGVKELWWDTKNKANAVLHPIETAKYAGKILKYQFERPSSKDIYLAKFTMSVIAGSATAAAAGAFFFGVGVDPTLLAIMTGARLFIGGTTRAYNRTIVNLTRMNLFDDMGVTSTVQQTTRRLSTLGVAIGQLYYSIGHTILGDSYPITQRQIFSNTATSGVIETAAAIERNNRLSDKARDNIYKLSLIIGSMLGAIGTMGHIGPIVFEWGFIQITALQAGSLAIFSSLLVSIKFFTHHVEITAQKSIHELYQRLRSLRSARAKRLLEERAAKQEDRRRFETQRQELRREMIRALEEARLTSARRTYSEEAFSAPVCSSLFR